MSLKMNGEKNVGAAERLTRTGLGVVFILGGVFLNAEPIVKLILAVAGIIVLMSGCSGHCMFYSLAGWSTNPGKKPK